MQTEEMTVKHITQNEIHNTAYGFVYITTNEVNGKRYIGQRKFSHGWQTYIGSGVVLQKAKATYGKKSFNRKIIELAYSALELNEIEAKLIKSHNAIKSHDFYNIADGGGAGNKYAGKTPEEMKLISEKMSKSLTGEKNPCFGRTGNKNPMYGTISPKARPVILINTSEVFSSATLGAKAYGIRQQRVSDYCNGKRKMAGTHPTTGEELIWRYCK